MTTLCMADYCPPAVVGDPREAAIRHALNDWVRPMELTVDQKLACVSQALTQYRNGMSTASAIAAGKDHAARLDQQNRSPLL